jgi:hypothetical protein
MRQLVILALLDFSFNGIAQTDTTDVKQLVVVQKFDGKEYIGYILEDDGREILLQTEALGKIYIRKELISKIVNVEDEKHIINGVYNTEGPFTTRYTFTTNALPIKKGENYAMVNLYGPEVHFAVSDNLNIGVMTTWIGSPFVLAMKYSMKTSNENVNFSVGLLSGTSSFLNSFQGFGGLAFGNVTIGDRRRNITFAGGYLYIDPNTSRKENFIREGSYETNYEYFSEYDLSDQSIIRIKNNVITSPMFSIAGYHQVGPRAAFVFDSMFGFVGGKLNDEVTTTEVSAPVGNEWDAGYIPGVYRHNVNHVQQSSSAMFIFMPGMRFQKDENRAFQVSVAGVLVTRPDRDPLSFPIPTASWYFRF